jgi:hypothetical protein
MTRTCQCGLPARLLVNDDEAQGSRARAAFGRRHGTGVMGAGMPQPPRRRIPQASFC